MTLMINIQYRPVFNSLQTTYRPLPIKQNTAYNQVSFSSQNVVDVIAMEQTIINTPEQFFETLKSLENLDAPTKPQLEKQTRAVESIIEYLEKTDNDINIHIAHTATENIETESTPASKLKGKMKFTIKDLEKETERQPAERIAIFFDNHADDSELGPEIQITNENFPLSWNNAYGTFDATMAYEQVAGNGELMLYELKEQQITNRFISFIEKMQQAELETKQKTEVVQ